MAEPSERNLLQGDPRFAQTQWSLVMKAARQDSSAGPALEKLCRAYWYPLYAFCRRTGLSPHDAEDTTQGFFLHLIGNEGLKTVDQQRGTFRSFLLASLKNFMSHEREHASAQKRGGGQTFVHLDDAEERYEMASTNTLSPDRLYDHGWACTLLERTSNRLQEQYEAAGKGHIFPVLRTTLHGRGLPYQAIMKELGMTEGAVKTAVHRLRDRYRAALRAEVADTVADPADVEDELRFLIESFNRL